MSASLEHGLNALKEQNNANILSTPSLLTLDNEEAYITVGQNAQATFFSTNFGQPWELLLGTSPLIPASGEDLKMLAGQLQIEL